MALVPNSTKYHGILLANICKWSKRDYDLITIFTRIKCVLLYFKYKLIIFLVLTVPVFTPVRPGYISPVEGKEPGSTGKVSKVLIKKLLLSVPVRPGSDTGANQDDNRNDAVIMGTRISESYRLTVKCHPVTHHCIVILFSGPLK